VTADERMEAAAKLYDAAAEELEQAVAHCRTAAQHFRDHVVPRGAAHAWAALGHIRAAEESLEEQAREHARRSNP
jgi:1-aminocyclopropane-1-carboxylate deaminase/D-cysteine desulfhydrase-like pyridoxal-dependent ACC family enzyme